MRTSKELQVGKAGEYLVCADLILKGFVAFPSEQGLPYDVVMDTGEKIFRIQVKTTSAPRSIPQRQSPSLAYIFNIKRAGKHGLTRYSNSEIDLFALVCLDTKQIGYLLADDMPDTINIRADRFRGTHRDERGIANHAKLLKMQADGISKADIATATGLNLAQVYRMLKEDYKPHETAARYFSDFERPVEWFLAPHRLRD
jgi:hypothetical protein